MSTIYHFQQGSIYFTNSLDLQTFHKPGGGTIAGECFIFCIWSCKNIFEMWTGLNFSWFTETDRHKTESEWREWRQKI